jgi:hypothetical protein
VCDYIFRCVLLYDLCLVVRLSGSAVHCTVTFTITSCLFSYVVLLRKYVKYNNFDKFHSKH